MTANKSFNLKSIPTLIVVILMAQACFQFDAPVEADVDVQECELLRDLNEGEDPWYHCNGDWETPEVLKEEGEMCCESSDCDTHLCVCGVCHSIEGFY